MERTIKLAIVDADSVYAERLAEGISQYPEYEISTFFDLDKFEDILSKKNYDVVLFSDALDLDTNISKKIVFIPLLEEQGIVRNEYASLGGVYKYQRVSAIYREILGKISLVRSAIESNSEAFLIGVFSPAGGVGKTTVSAVTALKLASSGKRVLYQNMECLSSGDAYFDLKVGERGVSDFLGYLDSDIDFSTQIQSLLYTKQENLYYMNPFRTPNDLLDLDSDEMRKFVLKLKKSGLFDYIVFDMDCGIHDKNLKLMEEMDTIAVVGSESDTAVRKLELFYSQSHIMSRISNKIMQIDNFSSGKVCVNKIGVPQIGKIGVYQNVGFADLVEQLAKMSSTDFVEQLIY